MGLQPVDLISGNVRAAGPSNVPAWWATEAQTDAERTPAQVALNWVTTRPGVVGTLVGATTVEQLDANLDALQISLSAARLGTLEAASDAHRS